MVWYGIIIMLERPLAQWATTKAPSFNNAPRRVASPQPGSVFTNNSMSLVFTNNSTSMSGN